MTAPWLIIGCGYTGAYLARALIGQSADVTITRRDGEAVQAAADQLGARGVRVDLAEPATLGGIVAADSIVVCLAPPGPNPAGEIAALVAETRHAKKLVYVSSTGVYAPAAGAWVDESWPLAPTTAHGEARVTAERALATAKIPWIVLRAAGIHGPGRKLVDRIRAGTYRIVGDGTTHVSRIHVVDLVAAIIAAGTSDVTGFVNVADDDPAPIGEVADAIADRLGVAHPPRVPADSVPPETAGMLTADRRIANRRLKEALGVELRYKSWRDAL